MPSIAWANFDAAIETASGNQRPIITSGRAMSRPLNRSSMVDMCYSLPRLRQRNNKSIYILRRIEQMRSDANFTLT
jgi:hypothetical protein